VISAPRVTCRPSFFLRDGRRAHPADRPFPATMGARTESSSATSGGLSALNLKRVNEAADGHGGQATSTLLTCRRDNLKQTLYRFLYRFPTEAPFFSVL